MRWCFKGGKSIALAVLVDGVEPIRQVPWWNKNLLEASMSEVKAIFAAEAQPRQKKSSYPEPFASRVAGRIKRPLGDLFGLKNFGVNLTTLPPGVISALHHRHSVQDEFIYIVAGEPTMVVGEETQRLQPGMVAGFPANGPAHHLRNDSDSDVVYLEIGDRSPGDRGSYPHDDLVAVLDGDGKWRFTRKDGTSY